MSRQLLEGGPGASRCCPPSRHCCPSRSEDQQICLILCGLNPFRRSLSSSRLCVSRRFGLQKPTYTLVTDSKRLSARKHLGSIVPRSVYTKGSIPCTRSKSETTKVTFCINGEAKDVRIVLDIKTCRKWV